MLVAINLLEKQEKNEIDYCLVYENRWAAERFHCLFCSSDINSKKKWFLNAAWYGSETMIRNNIFKLEKHGVLPNKKPLTLIEE